MGKVANLVFGERYGDVNDPKTNWSTVGAIMTRKGKDQLDPDQGDIEALQRLIAGGHIGIRVSAIPTSKTFDGWLSVFEPRERDQNAASQPQQGAGNPVDEGEPVDLSEIPF